MRSRGRRVYAPNREFHPTPPLRIGHEYLAIQVQQRVQAEVPDLLTHLSMLSVSDNVVNFPNALTPNHDTTTETSPCSLRVGLTVISIS